MACCKQKIPIRGVLVVVGGFMVYLTLGTQLSYGNTNPYLVSYVRKHSSPSDLNYVDGIWIQAWMLMGQGITMFLGGILERMLGLRLACLIGCWFLSAGVVLTRWSLTYNYVTSVVTYGVMFGLGCGIAYPLPITCVMRWFPKHRGLMGGLVFTGFGTGATVFNPIITVYLNPENVAPNQTIGEDVYFTQDEVLDRLPNLFLILGGTYAALQLLAIILMVDPPSDSEGSKIAGEEEKGEQASNKQTDTETKDTENTKTAYSSFGETGFSVLNDPKNIERSDQSISYPSATDGIAADSNIQAPDSQPASNNNPASVYSLHEAATSMQVRGKPAAEIESASAGRGTPSETGEAPVEMDIKPLQMLRKKQFYLLWFLFLFGGMGGVFMVAMFKSYGQSFIKDDHFIAVVGSCASVANGVGSILWGHVADRLSFDVTAKLIYTSFACIAFTFAGSEYGKKPYFLIWVCLIFFIISGKYTIMPPVLARMFGNKYMGTNYGLLYTSQVLTAAASAFMGEMLRNILHYHGLFYLIGSFSFIGFLITFFVDARMPDGKKI